MKQIKQLAKCTELLQFFTSTGVTFTASDNSIAATGIGSGFEADDFIVVAGSSKSGNNTTHKIEEVAADKLTISSDSTIEDDNAGETITINQEWQGPWTSCEESGELKLIVNCSGNAAYYIDQRQDKYASGAEYSVTAAITGGTTLAASVEVYMKEARLRLRNNGADQTSMRAFLNGTFGI